MNHLRLSLFLWLITASCISATALTEPPAWLPEQVRELIRLEIADQQARLQELAQSPVGAQISAFPTRDTLRSRLQWPLLQADTSKWQRAKSASRLLAGQLPFTSSRHAPLLIYNGSNYPETLVEMTRRFATAHTHAFVDSATLAVLPLIGDDRPVVIVAGLDTTESRDWFLALADSLADRPVALLSFGHRPSVVRIPSHWTAVRLPDSSRESQAFAGQLLYGAQAIDGQKAARAGYELPGAAWDRDRLQQVDRRMKWAIRRRTTPGAQLLVMHQGQIVWEKAYGHQDYRRRQAVSNDDLFDLASVTKAAATTLAVMHLYDLGAIELDQHVAHYLPQLEGYPAGRYRIDQLLTHQTGLQAAIPAIKFMGRTYVSTEADTRFSVPIGPDHWLDHEVPAKIADELRRVKYTRRPIHRYSDLNYYLLQLIVERVSQRSLDEYVQQYFYDPMGLERLSFNPYCRFSTSICMPSYYDPWMRESILQGYVHDESAALLGGVAGHAGLFSNARELGLLFQMLLDGGSWQGRQLIRTETVELFTSKYPYNYRALGFDRLEGGWPVLMAKGASAATYGHTGFSGTCVWVDPDEELIFVLLTNRVFPDAKNKRFSKYQVRARVHGDVYSALATAK